MLDGTFEFGRKKEGHHIQKKSLLVNGFYSNESLLFININYKSQICVSLIKWNRNCPNSKTGCQNVPYFRGLPTYFKVFKENYYIQGLS